ncbi:hypothetical protein FE840_007815 [Peteryoungia desertarenae]|uniref:Uncharacterized protein n=1 Tax=Peteryoungia desertarenae TaxID=1813451 RepID=A0ABX6QLH9_9HYPH|nr:hypothetical protein [Peteryoungia desertarenae]QLF69458.1 hypothetical protein FE840_007815 [Peteryoungia desertarenae]
MANTAVVLAGVPSAIHSVVLADLRSRYSTGYVFRVASSRRHKDEQAHYIDNEIDAILEASRDAIFGEKKRPSSFCRNPSQQCALNHSAGKRCALSEGQTCSLVKPDHFFLLFQPGENAKKLQEVFHYSPLAIPLSSQCYGRASRTVEAAVEAIGRGLAAVKHLKDNMSSLNSPYLLPPINYGMGIDKLFKIDFDIDKQQKKAKNFRVERFAGEDRAYKAKGDLRFSPTSTEIQHGSAGPQDRADIALTRHFRLGCTYEDKFHFDVTRADGHVHKGRTTLFCRQNGEWKPEKKNANLLVDDCMRGNG